VANSFLEKTLVKKRKHTDSSELIFRTTDSLVPEENAYKIFEIKVWMISLKIVLEVRVLKSCYGPARF